jgi:hypothetical protein
MSPPIRPNFEDTNLTPVSRKKHIKMYEAPDDDAQADFSCSSIEFTGVDFRGGTEIPR